VAKSIQQHVKLLTLPKKIPKAHFAMKKVIRSTQPVTMLYHVKEIRMRFFITVSVLIAGMIAGYFFYDPLFQFIKMPLHGALHYTSPAGSFNFVIKICLMVGVSVSLPVAVYNAIMFVQPALKKQLSKLRVYTTTFLSLLFGTAGAAFAFFVIIPLALQFFYKFQVDGLVALISADDYLRFVVNVVVTFVIIFQLPLFISLIDHIWPLPPKKMFKAEKYIIVGSLTISLLVPFALDPAVQLLIASPIIVLYNLSIAIVVMQHTFKNRQAKTQITKRPELIKYASPVTTPSVPPIKRPRLVSDVRPMRRENVMATTEISPKGSTD
jgi:sec-independent protein translocase protein TatC